MVPMKLLFRLAWTVVESNYGRWNVFVIVKRPLSDDSAKEQGLERNGILQPIFWSGVITTHKTLKKDSFPPLRRLHPPYASI